MTLAVRVMATLVLVSPVIGADNWPRFRGPNGAGLSDAKTIPVKWTEQDFNWRVELPGVGHSSPAIWGDRIFLTCADDKAARRTVCCLSAADGTLLWRRDYESKPHRFREVFSGYANSSPAVDSQCVYAYWTSPWETTLLALTHDGKDVWRRDLGKFHGPYGSGASPIVLEDMVIQANDQEGTGFLLAVDRETGETRWKHERKNRLAPYSTPCIVRPDGGPPQAVFFCVSHGITSLDARTGKVVWEQGGVFLLPGGPVGSPIVASGLIVGGSGSGTAGHQFVAVRPGTKGKPQELAYRLEQPVSYITTPIAVGDLLFLWTNPGRIRCLRASTGEEVWVQRVSGDFFGSPVCVDGRLYCIARKGEVVVIAAKDRFELLARNPLGEKSQATPAIAGGRMYLRTWTHLISIGGGKPR